MNNWIFVIRDNESIFELRMKNKEWPIYPGTKFQTFLEIGDQIIFYRAGLHAQKFLGTAVVNSKIKVNPEKIDRAVSLKKIHIWENHLSIRELLPKLSFIKNKDNWGLHMQGGILKLNEVDYSKIIKSATIMIQN